MTRPSAAAFDLSIVIPTLNESLNIVPLLERLDHALEGISWEVVFVDDDSQDGTAAQIRKIGRTRQNVRVLHRIGRRGLSSACMEGILGSSAPYIAVMDADMQHDETILPEMLAQVRDGHYDIAVGSRNVGGGSMGNFSKSRVLLSNTGKRLSQRVCKIEIQDPILVQLRNGRSLSAAAVRTAFSRRRPRKRAVDAIVWNPRFRYKSGSRVSAKPNLPVLAYLFGRQYPTGS